MITNWILKIFILIYCAVQISTFYQSITRPTYKKTSLPEAPPFKAAIAASFPGGNSAWIKYLTHNLNYPPQAEKSKVETVVRVQYIIDTMGNIVDVQAQNDDDFGFSEEAERVIKKSPKWRPARLDGKKIEYHMIQIVTFSLK